MILLWHFIIDVYFFMILLSHFIIDVYFCMILLSHSGKVINSAPFYALRVLKKLQSHIILLALLCKADIPLWSIFEI